MESLTNEVYEAGLKQIDEVRLSLICLSNHLASV